MDDFIGSFESVEKASQLAAEIVTIHSHAGFEMRGCVSNLPKALSLIPSDLVLTPSSSVDSIDLGSLKSTKIRTLGLIWQPQLDIIGFNTGVEKDTVLPNELTKRKVLSHVMRIYDPLGILAPIVVRGRIMFQNAWRKYKDWDDKFNQEDLNNWKAWLLDLKELSKLTLPRQYSSIELHVTDRELHVFSDSSQLAFVAVAYWRFVCSDESIKLALISSKARVFPLRPVSIPRLELQGALLASRLATTICKAHRYKPTKRVFWCDSTTVNGWLKSDARTLKPFVSHRVGEILENTDVNEWRWVPSGLNVADDATRLERDTLSQESRWITGPSFLLKESTNWPVIPTEYTFTKLDDGLKEIKPSFCASVEVNRNVVEVHYQPLAAESSHFSSWLRLIRATATAHKFISLLRMKCLQKRGVNVFSVSPLANKICTFRTLASGSNPNSSQIAQAQGQTNTKALTAQNIQLAEVHILQRCQNDTFAIEIDCIKNKKILPQRSRLNNLTPIIADDGLLRLSGRIIQSNIDNNMKFPIILDGKHAATRLLIEHYHRKAAHANTEMVVNELRQRYWILNLRSSVRSVQHSCQFCRIRRAKTMQPPMGNLPVARLSHHKRPFTFTGLDYFGPLLVAIGRRREKRYVAIYTCLVTRAIHLEIVNNLTTDSALMSLRRFAARRGTPSEIYSDNGTAFVGASRELRSLYGESISQYAANEQIKWNFIPPSAPFMGGAWERMVRSAKTALKVTLRERTPTEETLSTLLAEAESLVNSHPLTHVAPDADFPEALTPNHFIMGSSSGHPIPAVLSDRDLSSRSSWRKAVRLTDHFWRRWLTEYLPSLQPRRGGGIASEIIICDVVLIAANNLPRGTRPKGRVVAKYTGTDNFTRVIDVQTSTGILRRPVKKIVVLPTVL